MQKLQGCYFSQFPRMIFLDCEYSYIFKISADLYIFQHFDMKIFNKTESIMIFLSLIVSFKKGLIYRNVCKFLYFKNPL